MSTIRLFSLSSRLIGEEVFLPLLLVISLFKTMLNEDLPVSVAVKEGADPETGCIERNFSILSFCNLILAVNSAPSLRDLTSSSINPDKYATTAEITASLRLITSSSFDLSNVTTISLGFLILTSLYKLFPRSIGRLWPAPS